MGLYHDKGRTSLTGCWMREGANGKFYSGSFKRSELIEALQNNHGEEIQLFVNEVQKTKDGSPDLSISLKDQVPYKG